MTDLYPKAHGCCSKCIVIAHDSCFGPEVFDRCINTECECHLLDNN
jgi:hypothetical protein